MTAMRCQAYVILTVMALIACSSCSKEMPADNSPASVNHAELWESKNKTGLDALANNDLEKAETDLVSGLSEADACGHDDPRVAVSLNNLASLYEKRKMYSQCAAYLKRSRELFRKAYGENAPAIAITMKNEARILGAQGKYAEALPLYKDAAARLEKTKSPELSSTLTGYADALRHLNKKAEADSVEKKAKNWK